jgi:hypothetical protein
VRAARMLRIAAAATAAMAIAAAPARANIGTEGPSFPGATAPTGEKPQSKLWFNDGIWWGVLFSSTTRDFEIFRYDAGHWTSTQTKVDLRNNTWADAKWDGTHLNVVSHGPAAASGTPDVAANNVRYSRYSYDPIAKQYIRDVSEVPLTSYGVKAAVIDADSNGRLYVTWTHALRVWIDYTTTGPTAWATPIVLPVKKLAQLPVDEISSVVHYNHAIGVMWSNEKTGAYYFASHDDSQQPNGGWRTATAFQGPEFSDDHLNVKALSNDPAGQVFGIVKTSLDRVADPLQVLVVMDDRGQWHHYTVWNHGPVTAENTRAQVAVDLGRRELYAFSAAPCCAGGIVYMKKTSLDHPSFDAASLGTPILSGDGEHINNPTTSKQPLDASTGLLVMASADNTRHYWHALLPLDGPDLTPPDTTITQGPAGETSETSAQIAFESSEQQSSFTCTLDGVPYSPCSSPAALSALAPGQHTFSVAATDLAGNSDPTPATRTWTVSSTAALFADDFEGGDLSRWSTIGTGPEGSVGLETDTVAGGVAAARLSATSTTGSYAYLRKDLSPAPASASIAFTERVDTQGASGGNVPLLRVYSPSGTRLLSLYRPNGSSNVVYVNHSGSFAPTAGRLPLAMFRHFEVQMTSAGDGASTLAVLVDGVEVYRTATANLGIAGLGRIQFGNDTKAQPLGVVVDDVEVR